MPPDAVNQVICKAGGCRTRFKDNGDHCKVIILPSPSSTTNHADTWQRHQYMPKPRRVGLLSSAQGGRLSSKRTVPSAAACSSRLKIADLLLAV